MTFNLRYPIMDVAGWKYHEPYADVAHLVERHLAKVEVASSSLVIRSSFVESVGDYAGAFCV